MTHGKSVVVPVEPMPEMIAAWYRVKNGHHFHDESEPTDTSDYAAYRAMLAAAPAPSSLAGGARERVAEIVEAAILRHHPSACVSDTLDDADAILAALSPEAPASPSERELDLLDAVMRAGGIVKTAAALPDKSAHLSLLTDALNQADAILTEGLNGAPVSHEAPAEAAGEPWGWDREVCTGCSSSLTFVDIKARGCVSCCPDRRMVKVRDLVDAYEAARSSAPEARSTVSVLAEALHDRMFGVSSLKDPTLALDEISDGGGLHEAAHELLRALPPRGPAPEAREGEVVAIGRNIRFTLSGEYGNAVVSPDAPDGMYWTLIGQGPDEDQNAMVAEIARRLNGPSAPIADKLRIAVEALTRIRMMRSDRKPGSYPNSYKGGFDAASDLAADWSSRALATLKAEGAA